MDMIGFAGIPETMSQRNLVAHLQATFSGRFCADDKLIRASESPAFVKRPGDAVHWLECCEEVAVGCDHRNALVGITYLRRHGPCPGEARDDLLVLLK